MCLCIVCLSLFVRFCSYSRVCLCLSVCLCVCMSVCLSICLSVRLFMFLSVCLHLSREPLSCAWGKSLLHYLAVNVLSPCKSFISLLTAHRHANVVHALLIQELSPVCRPPSLHSLPSLPSLFSFHFLILPSLPSSSFNSFLFSFS